MFVKGNLKISWDCLLLKLFLETLLTFRPCHYLTLVPFLFSDIQAEAARNLKLECSNLPPLPIHNSVAIFI